MSAKNSSITLWVNVQSTPSLVKSSLSAESEVAEGEEVTIAIDPRDEDGLSIAAARGRYFEIRCQPPDGREFELKTRFEDLKFVAILSKSDLSEPGEYKFWVHSWYDGRETLEYMLNRTSADPMGLPTKGYPRSLIAKNGMLQVVLGVCVGITLVVRSAH